MQKFQGQAMASNIMHNHTEFPYVWLSLCNETLLLAMFSLLLLERPLEFASMIYLPLFLKYGTKFKSMTFCDYEWLPCVGDGVRNGTQKIRHHNENTNDALTWRGRLVFLGGLVMQNQFFRHIAETGSSVELGGRLAMQVPAEVGPLNEA